MRRLIARLARAEGGFAMIPTIGIMVACGLLALAAFTSAMGDLPLARGDQGRKSSMDAAEAGVAWYAAKLKADPDYWTKCGAVPDPDGGTARPPVSGTPIRPGLADARVWRSITPGSALQFTVELLPVRTGSCSSSDPAGTMLDNNRMRIRVTGRNTATGGRRTLVATFRRPSFLNYVYFTDYEVIDPDADGASGTTVSNCGIYWRDGRRNNGCSEIQWGSGDVVSGPIHTNDILNINGTPTFGRSGRSDRIETTDPAGSRSSGTNGAKYLGVKLFGIDALQLPPNDDELATLTDGNLVFTGPTQLQLQRGQLRWRSLTPINTATKTLGAWQTAAYPANGLVFVQSRVGAACTATTVYSKYDMGNANYAGCGDIYVSGTYDRSLTIAAANDVVIAGDLKRATTTELLGLIGNNYVRVMNPVTFDTSYPNSCTSSDRSTNASNTTPYALRDSGDGTMRFPFTTPTIQAGILAVNHSFMVDNYACGSSQGTLNVTGAIAQKYRGPVATTSGSTYTSGYRKNYVYDDLLGYREPPNFLDPLKAAWIFTRQVEQTPAS